MQTYTMNLDTDYRINLMWSDIYEKDNSGYSSGKVWKR